MNKLRPQHPSKIGRPPRPTGLQITRLGVEGRMMIESIALDIFTDMTNAGATLQQTLAAIYLSGAENALEALKDHGKP